MNRIVSIFILITVALHSCSKNYNNPEEELCAIMKKNGWEQISNSTNVYRKDFNNETSFWYQASIYAKESGGDTKYIIARPVYKNREESVAYRLEDGKLKYKTFPIVDCNYTDAYGRKYNGYISDSGCTAYINY